MRRKQAAGIFAVVALAAASLIALQLGILPAGGGGTHTTAGTTCADCFQQEPVVDIIMPALGSLGNTTNPDRVMNLTQGSTTRFEVDVYPTTNLTFSMGFRSVLVTMAPGGTGANVSGAITATFSPQTLALGANEKGATQMTVRVGDAASKGSYDAVVSAFDIYNSSEVWGLYFQINVG